MFISDISLHLEGIAPLSLQEDYDNSGLIVGRPDQKVKGILISLDCIESTIEEAISKKCNLIISHHPIVFKGLKRFNSADYVQRCVERAIRHDIAIYAIHTNLDNVLQQGVNTAIAKQIGIDSGRILLPRSGGLIKLACYVPSDHVRRVQDAMFSAGAGHIGNYSECSFSSEGWGTFKGNEQSNPFVGDKSVRHSEKEERLEVILRANLQNKVLSALRKTHPYEEPAYEFYPTLNSDPETGAGLIGSLPVAMLPLDFLAHIKSRMNAEVIRYTPYEKAIQKVAICGGSGSFLLSSAKAAGADALVTADFKYHQFFDAEEKLMICDVGHYESEKCVIDLLYEIITEKFTTFAVLKTEGYSNPIKYFH